MENTAPNISIVKSSVAKKSDNILHRIQSRRSKELILAFCGQAGSDIPRVIDKVKSELEVRYGYNVEIVKVSGLLKDQASNVIPDFMKVDLNDHAKRYLELQKAGNELRKAYGHQILAQLAIKYIRVNREARYHSQGETSSKPEAEDRQPQRVAYLIDSLKHPAEVEFMRAVYRNMFFLFGIFCTPEKRRKYLTEKPMKSADAEKIMEIDRKQDEDYGQQVMKTLQHSDFFINSEHPNPEALKTNRYIDLILDTKAIITSTLDEYAMYVAQSAAMRSGCLSRQIGASIVNSEGEIIAVGYNDVPKKGGGLYCSADGEGDFRCLNVGNECQSDKYKSKIIDKIKQILVEEFSGNVKVQEAVSRIEKESRIKDLIEFSRAVHAEMEAIMSAARSGISPKGGTLYTTTFPCHNCARHIVAAGIEKVLFIEPYEKSLAMTLHGESILLNPAAIEKEYEKVIFSHFEGVAPRQYANLFLSKTERKFKGKGITVLPSQAIPVLPEYIDSWEDVEAKVVEDLTNKLSGDKEI